MECPLNICVYIITQTCIQLSEKPKCEPCVNLLSQSALEILIQ